MVGLTFQMTTIILILAAWYTKMRNLEKCGQNLGVLQCKMLTSDLSESKTCHISQMKAFFMLIARYEWLLAALGGIRDILNQSWHFWPQKLINYCLILKEDTGGALAPKLFLAQVFISLHKSDALLYQWLL